MEQKLFCLYTNGDHWLTYYQGEDLEIKLGELDVTRYCIEF